jgi:translation elongation factor P/translation initiation factor 5A
MNIKSTKCILTELSKKQIDTLIEAMPKDGLFDFGHAEGLIGFSGSGRSGTWIVDGNETIISYTEMMQLLGKTMKEFTKSDLKTGMFVKNRDGNYKVVIGGVLEVLSGIDTCTRLGTFSDSLISNNCKGLDIVAVYKVQREGYLRTYLQGESLTLIWERTEQTPAQKEMEVLQAKMDELQEQMKVVQAKL